MASKYEPWLDAERRRMKVGDYHITPTNTLTALLYGFAKHPQPSAKEFYFWRIADELWNKNDDLPGPLFLRHPWAVEMIRQVTRNKYVAIGGAASSGKSYVMAAWGIVCWLAQPANTMVMLTSTSLRDSKRRIWGAVTELLAPISDLIPGKIRDSIGSVAYVDKKGVLNEKSGLLLVASDRSKGATQNNKLLGSKQNTVIVIADELSELAPTLVTTAISNMSKNPHLQVIGMSNPNSRFDAFGDWAEPRDGWDSVNTLVDDGWTTKYGGAYIRLDGERSPNIIAGETLYPFLPTLATLEEDKAILGPESRSYMRMVRAVFFDADEAETVYTEAEITRAKATAAVAQWAAKPKYVAGLDPAFTNGGDRCVLRFARVGYRHDNHYVLEFGDTLFLHDDANDKSTPRSYQLAERIIRECKKRGLHPEDLAVDATSGGNPFCDVLDGAWGGRVQRVQFGGTPSDRRVSALNRKPAKDLYTNRVGELWFVGKELIRTKQIYGLDGETAREMCARRYDLIKTGNLKMRLEPKPEFKARFGRSPDLADASFLALDCARIRYGLVAQEPPQAAEGLSAATRPPRSFRQLNQALVNSEAYLVHAE